ncbi:hypothetical protein Daus18300_005487 [Diaporthe australafricana]|uniref:DUF7730 domain-containing protein n=1 Tax=Diaporthe australafricana TaxID=127596 RepID=A0ABR3X1N6_9PEZI
MAANVTQGRYPKRSRAPVNYNVENMSIDDDIDLDDGDTGGESTAADGSDDITVVAAGGDADGDSDSSLSTIDSARPLDELDELSELEDATYGSRKTKKRLLAKKKQAKPQSVVKRPPKFMPFRFMDLPPELRLKVYEEALVDPHGVHITTFSNKWESTAAHVHPTRSSTSRYGLSFGCYVRGQWSQVFSGNFPLKKYKLSPNILAASKTIHGEAVDILWTQPFIFDCTDSLHEFLLMLRPETIAQLRDITLGARGWDTNARAFQAFVLLRNVPLLQNFRLTSRIRMDSRSFNSTSSEVEAGKRIAARLYKGSRPFLQELIKHQGFDSILKVFKFPRDEFNTRHFDAAAGNWVYSHWSQAREDKILEAISAELKVIMDAKINIPHQSKFRR